jgi:hypothetical protein
MTSKDVLRLFTKASILEFEINLEFGILCVGAGKDAD